MVIGTGRHHANTNSFPACILCESLPSIPRGIRIRLMVKQSVTWVGLAICIPAYIFRVYVRHTVFGRLLLDDYLVLIALLILAGTSITAQSTVHHIYAINGVTASHSPLPADPDFLFNTSLGIRAFGGALLSYLVALYTIKFSFLVFFRRLGGQLTEYMVMWWIVLGLNVAFCMISLGMVPHSCFFGSVEEALFSAKCGGTGGGRDFEGGSRPNSLIFVAVCLLDVVSDFLILGFPIVILCRVRVGIAVRKKVLLSAIFGLVILTIAVTIVRVVTVGAEFYREGEDETGDSGKSTAGLDLSAVWILYHVELAVGKFPQCLLPSFRFLLDFGR
ncbi:hypothetical protein V8F20_008117 [Naviculisporaceae sp. PSN 640]